MIFDNNNSIDNHNTELEINVDDNNLNDHHQSLKNLTHQLSPSSPTHTIRSASTLDRSSGSESPQLIVDNLPTSPISLCNSSMSATDNMAEEKSLSAQQSGLLDMLMNPDKCQVGD